MSRSKIKRSYNLPIDLSQTKVVGRNGKPLLVYRGEFGVADGNPTGFQATRASYSFGDVKIANHYSKNGPASSYIQDGRERAPKVFAVYLDIRNPVVNWEDPFIEYPELLAAVGDELALKLLIKHQNYVFNTSNWRERIDPQRTYGDVATLSAQAPHLIKDLYLDIFPILDDPEFVEAAKKRGFDGAIYNGTGENLSRQEYRIFDQSQAIFALSGERAQPELPQLPEPPAAKRSRGQVREVDESPSFSM
jgi:hypothetical protein